MASRAFAFTILGIAIGALIGLTHIVLKRAWLTILDGFRPGRQLILDQVTTVLGRGDHLPLPLLGPTARDVENEHAQITRRADGAYVVEDRGTRIGTLLNGERLLGPVVLNDGDLVRLGGNILRFNQHRGGPLTALPSAPQLPATALPPEAPPLAPAVCRPPIGPPLPLPPVAPPVRPPVSPPVPPPPLDPAARSLPGGGVAPRRPGMPPPPAPRPPAPGPKIPPPPPPPGRLR